VASRRYAERDLAATVRDLLDERAASVAWLRELEDPNWLLTHEHPQIGPLRAGDLLASWVAHDALHLRQLSRLQWGWTRHLGLPFSPTYAGGW